MYSQYFRISSGVRQGGILSPTLFAICVDDVLKKLEKAKISCYFNLQCVNSIMYADDLILLSASVSDLQNLVDLCVIEFDQIGLEINVGKSSRVRIGQRHVAVVSPITICDKSL